MNLNLVFTLSVILSGVLLSMAIDWQPGYGRLIVQDDALGWALLSVVISLVLYVLKNKARKSVYSSSDRDRLIRR